jgi:hypothetical protein
MYRIIFLYPSVITSMYSNYGYGGRIKLETYCFSNKQLLKQWKSVTPSAAVNMIDVNTFNWRISICPWLGFSGLIFYTVYELFPCLTNIPPFFLPINYRLQVCLRIWVRGVSNRIVLPKIKHSKFYSSECLWECLEWPQIFPEYSSWQGYYKKYVFSD